jgi:transcription termination factor Rho
MMSIPVAGILDIPDNYAFIRTSSYLPGPTCLCPLSNVRKYALRKGDAITGAVRQPATASAGEIHCAGAAGHHQRHGAGAGARPDRVRQADAALPAGQAQVGDGPSGPPRVIDLVAPLGRASVA